MAKRPCLACGTPTLTSRCRSCASAKKAVRNAHAPHARALIAAWVERHGWWCPGWRIPPHESNDLTADHTTPLAAGNTSPPERVLCRSCNSRKRDIVDDLLDE